MSDDADLLRRAAKRVRSLGAAATPGPWSRAMKTRTKSAIVAPTPEGPDERWDREHTAICSVPHWDGGGGFLRKRAGRDLDWIALASPHIAEPIAAWLERAADRADLVSDPTPPQFPAASPEAVCLARALLGEPPP